MKTMAQLIVEMRDFYREKKGDENKILNAPGLCNGFLNHFFFQCLENMKDGVYSLKVAQQAAQRLKEECLNLTESNKMDFIHRICFLQNPNYDQPHGSPFPKKAGFRFDSLNKLHGVMNQNLDARLIHKDRGIAGVFSNVEFKDILAHYFEVHPNQFMRLATPTHVIGLGCHLNTVDGSRVISVFNARGSLDNILRTYEYKNESDLNNCVMDLGNLFYGGDFGGGNLFRSFVNQNFGISLKIYRVHSKPNVDPMKFDSTQVNSLFIASMFNHKKEVKCLLNRPETDPSQKCLTGFNLTALDIASQSGNSKICLKLRDHSQTRQRDASSSSTITC